MVSRSFDLSNSLKIAAVSGWIRVSTSHPYGVILPQLPLSSQWTRRGSYVRFDLVPIGAS